MKVGSLCRRSARKLRATVLFVKGWLRALVFFLTAGIVATHGTVTVPANADATAYIQRLINAAGLSTSRTCDLPAGTYRCGTLQVKGPLCLSGHSKVCLKFHGQNGLVIRGDHVAISGLRLVGNTARVVAALGTPNYDLTITHCIIQQSTVTAAKLAAAAIYIDGYSDVHVSDCVSTVLNGAPGSCHGIVINSGWGGHSSRLSIQRCHISGPGATFGITIFNGDNAIIAGCTVEHIHQASLVASGYGITLYAKTGAILRDKINGNRVQYTDGSGIYIADGVDAVVSCNTVADSCLKQSAISLPVGGIAINGGKGCVIYRNDVFRSDDNGVALTSPFCIVTGNVLQCCRNAGVHLRGSGAVGQTIDDNVIRVCKVGVYQSNGPLRNASIRGNVFSACTSAAIFAQFATNCRLIDNAVKSCGHGIQIVSPSGCIVSQNRPR
jgi:parallel beta-helix repeat protein